MEDQGGFICRKVGVCVSGGICGLLFVKKDSKRDGGNVYLGWRHVLENLAMLSAAKG